MVLKNGLSRMRGDPHVRFLGGGGAAMRRCYPTAWYVEGNSKAASHTLHCLNGKRSAQAQRAGGVRDQCRMAVTRHEAPVQPYQPELSDDVGLRPFRALVDQAQPVRRSFQGRQAKRGGDGPSADPLEATAVRSAAGAKASPLGTANRRGAPRPQRRGGAPMVSANHHSAGATIDCKRSITPGSTNTHGWSIAIDALNTWPTAPRLRWASRPVR